MSMSSNVNTQPSVSDDAVVQLDGVWKIFGERATEAMDAIREKGIGKPEVLEQFGAVVGVKDASFSVKQGEIFCLMGLSGSGKSTLVRHVNRLIEPTAGRILINGTNVGELNPEDLRAMRAEKIGMVFQNMALLPHRSVIDNVAFALELRKVDAFTRAQVANKVIELVGLEGYGDRMPSELSGGMQQRVGLARAMAADPDILLMDEPFSALDPLIRRNLQDEFLALSQHMHKTTLFITHDLDEAIRMGSRIAIMKDGEIVQTGTPEEIVTQPADDYVADFVAGISKLKLIFAHTVMTDVEQYEHANGSLPPTEQCPQAGPDDDLDKLVGVSLDQDNPIVIIDDNKPVGVVTKDALLRGIQGEV
ncbi:MAG: betaine/proline/choline family ABC transporter ATP-binding protein [Pseudomonadota bacterium]